MIVHVYRIVLESKTVQTVSGPVYVLEYIFIYDITTSFKEEPFRPFGTSYMGKLHWGSYWLLK